LAKCANSTGATTTIIASQHLAGETEHHAHRSSLVAHHAAY
jgi:hypothetical protein